MMARPTTARLWLKPPSGGGRRRQARESWTGVVEYRLGMVGERSSGEEGES